MPRNDNIDYEEAHKEIDEAIEASVHETPASVTEIEEMLNNKYWRTLIHRRFLRAWQRRGTRWVRREDESDE